MQRQRITQDQLRKVAELHEQRSELMEPITALRHAPGMRCQLAFDGGRMHSVRLTGQEALVLLEARLKRVDEQLAALGLEVAGS